MNAIELLSRWPGWTTKTQDEILASEAWAMRARWGDEDVVLRLSKNRPRDIIALKIAFDDEVHFLGIGERETFPDLAILWDRKNDIPNTLVLALVEKECGKLLQLLENSVRRQLSIIGLTDVTERDGTQGFEVVNSKGVILASFALNLSPMVKESLGDIAAIDVNHPSIRAMTRPAKVEYASFMLGEESSTLEPGDYLLSPELSNPIAARWCIDPPIEDGRFHIRSTDTTDIPFANFVDETMPTIAPPTALELFKGKTLIAAGHAAQLGETSAMAIEEVC